MSPQQEVRSLLNQIRILAGNNQGIERASNQIEVLVRAYLEPDQSPPLPATITGRLGPTEKSFFNLLHARMGQTVSRNALMDARYFHADTEPSNKIIDVQMCHLRKKLENTGYRIESIWGMGYRMVQCQPGKEGKPKFTNKQKHQRFAA